METAVYVIGIWIVSGVISVSSMRYAEDRIARKYPQLGTPEEQRERYSDGMDAFMVFFSILLGPLGAVGSVIANSIYFSGEEWRDIP